MKKRMIIFGGNVFIDTLYKEVESKRRNNGLLMKLRKKFDIDNFSKNTLTTEEAYKYLKVFLKNRKYDFCILALGENTENESTFSTNAEKIVQLLEKYKVHPILISPTIDVEEVINQIACKRKLEYACVYDKSSCIELKKALIKLSIEK